MSGPLTVEERLTILENDLAELKHQLGLEKPGEDWIRRMCGGFTDNPVFDEIVRLGKELRDAEPPVGDSAAGAEGAA